MKDKIIKLAKHPLIAGSFIIVVGNNISNVFNLFYNFFVVRNLQKSDYGTLLPLVSVITLFALVAESFVPLIVNYAAIHFAKKELSHVKGLFWGIGKVIVVIGLAIFSIFLFFPKQIGVFLNIHDQGLIIITGLCIFFGFLNTINRALLQAKLSFKFLSFINISAAAAKLLATTILVYAGFRIYGALFGFIIAFIIPYALSFIQLRFVFDKADSIFSHNVNSIIKFGLPSVASMFALTLFITSDILLVKHFFDADTAGLYAGMGIVGKVIYYFSAPIASVMFPIVVQKYAKKENYHHDFFLTLLIVLLPSLFLTIAYFLYPSFVIIAIMKREEYLKGATILGYFGIYYAAYSLLTVVVNFYISIQKTKVFIPLTIFSLLQILLIWFYHNSLLQIISISLILICLLLFLLLLYYLNMFRSSRKIKKNLNKNYE